MNWWRNIVLGGLLAWGNILNGGVAIDEPFLAYEAIRSECEAQTVLLNTPGGIILGGPGTKGEKAGFRFTKNLNLSTFTLLLEKMFWSHNQALGGHPTGIQLQDNDGNGYGVAVADRKLEIFAIDRAGNRRSLAVSPPLWKNEDGWTRERNLFFRRSGDGTLRAGFDGLPEVSAKDTQFGTFHVLRLSYGVYMHGYGLKIGRIYLTDADALRAAPKFSAAPDADWGVLDGEADKHPLRRRDTANAAAAALANNGRRVRVVPAGRGDFARLKNLMVSGEGIADADLAALPGFLRRGGRLVFWNNPDWDASTPERQAAIYRFLDKALGILRCPPVTALKFDRDRWQGMSLPPTAAPLDTVNTISRQMLPDSVLRRDLLTGKYRGRNWVAMEDEFTGSVVQTLDFRNGDFVGARIVYAGLPLTTGSPADPEGQVFNRYIGLLAREAERPLAARLPEPEKAPVPAQELTRDNFHTRPDAKIGALCFLATEFIDDPRFEEDVRSAGLDFVSFCIPWLLEEKDGEVIDWALLDRLVANARRLGVKIMLDPYAWNFNWGAMKWRGKRAAYDPVFETRYLRELRKVALRYKDEPMLAAMWISSCTGDGEFRISDSPEVRELWRRYLTEKRGMTAETMQRRYQAPGIPWPVEKTGETQNVGPLWSDFIEFHLAHYQDHLRKAIRTVREVIPNLPLAIRTGFMDPAPAMNVASEFPNVSAHCECIETSMDTEAFFRGYALGFGVPISAENGWPKCHAPAFRWAMADYLMGNYTVFTYSFAGPRGARESFPEIHAIQKLKAEMGACRYPSGSLGLLLPDATLYSSKPANLFSIEKLPSLRSAMERLGFAFAGISTEIPRLANCRVILDDGACRIFSPHLKEELAAWVRGGGTLLMFPTTGAMTRDGSGPFADALKIPAQPGVYRVGEGTVKVLKSAAGLTDGQLAAVLERNGQKPLYRLNRPVCGTLLQGEKHPYLILFDKSPGLRGGFFTESNLARSMAEQKPVELQIRPTFAFRKAFDAFSGKELAVRNHTVAITLNPTRIAVVRFE